METYKEIYERMRAAYIEKSGNEPGDVSDIALRMQVLAGEVYRLQARMEWLWKQAFPQTADGVQLDLHGAQRGIERGGSGKASGMITFSRYIPFSMDLVIPKGTVCASYGGEAVEYVTTEEAVLPAGQVAISVPAEAVTGGSAGNAAAGYINTMISDVSGINYVTNINAFSGGTDPERDEDYRARILESMARLESFGSAGYYEAIALEQDGVVSAQAGLDEDGSGVAVYVWGDGEAPSDEVIAEVQEKLSAAAPLGVQVTVQAATTKRTNIGMNLEMRAGVAYAAASPKITAAVKEWLAKKRVGDGVFMADVFRIILDTEPGVARVTFNAATKDVEGELGVVPVAGMVITVEVK